MSKLPSKKARSFGTPAILDAFFRRFCPPLFSMLQKSRYFTWVSRPGISKSNIILTKKNQRSGRVREDLACPTASGESSQYTKETARTGDQRSGCGSCANGYFHAMDKALPEHALSWLAKTSFSSLWHSATAGSSRERRTLR